MLRLMHSVVAAGVCAAALFAAQSPALAQSGKSAGDIVLRARGLGVFPDVSSSVTAIGGKVDVDDDYVPELDISYFVTDNIALELIAATTRHNVRDNGSTIGNVNLGKVSLLPPTLTLQYHFMPKAQFSPYVGAGVNYTIFYDEDAPGGTVTNISYDDSFGWALQAGIDVQVAERWSLNFDVKKLFLNTDVSINSGAIKGDVDLDPWIVGIGVGYRF